MFASPQLAARIDRAEGRLCADVARVAGTSNDSTFAIQIGGGVAAFAGPGSPTNKLIGIGFEGLPSEEDLARVEHLFAERQASFQAEISTLADAAVHRTLVQRGYELTGFENVLGCPLADVETPVQTGIVIEPVTEEERDAWIDVLVKGFGAPDSSAISSDASLPEEALRHWMELTARLDGMRQVAARIDGALVGGAALRIDDGMAHLSGAATLSEFRGRGVQTALLRWRLAYARSLGCDLAVVTTQPASKSQQNVQRSGFRLLYSRQIFVKSA